MLLYDSSYEFELSIFEPQLPRELGDISKKSFSQTSQHILPLIQPIFLL